MSRSTLLFFAIVILASTSAHALFDSKVEKAQKLIQVERYADALQLLDEAILDDPTDPETHFGVGQAYLSMGRDAQAEKTFSVLVRKLDAAYGPKIAKLYLDKGDWRRAVEFDPGRKVGLAQEFFTKGKASLAAGDAPGASRSFQAATSLDPSLNAEIHEVYYRKGAEASDEACLAWYQEARKYGSAHREEIAQRLVGIAKGKEGSARKALKTDFSAFLNEAEAKEAFPPPTWKTVFKQEYIGNGMAFDDCVLTVSIDEVLKKHDRVYFIGDQVDVWSEGKQVRKEMIEILYIKKGHIGNWAPKGQPFTVVVKRLSE